MKPLATVSRLLPFVLFAISVFSQTNGDLRYNYEYSCNKERIVIGHCRKDSDMPGFAPTKPEDNYCQVYYPDRPKTGGFEAMGTVLRGDIIKTLEACGALRQEQLVGQASNDDADDSNAEFKTGKDYYDSKDYAKAAEHFKKAADMDHSSFAAYLYLGMTHYNLKQYPKAIDAIKVTISMTPTMPEAHYWLGVSYAGLDQYTSAESELREAIRLNADYQGAYEWLGVALSKQKEYPDAIKSFQEALRLKPDDDAAIYSMGLTYARMGQKENAMRVYKTLQTMNQNYAQSLLAEITGSAAATQGANRENGPAATSKPAASAVGGTAALVAKAKTYFETKDYAKAIEASNKALAIEPNNPKANQYLALSYYQSEQWEAAVLAWNRSIPLAAPYPDEFILLGNANQRLGYYDEALKAYQKALELKPDAKISSGVYYWIGVTYNKMKRYDMAVTVLLDSVRRNPNYHYARKELGQSYMFLGRNEEGIASFKETIRLKPNDAETHYFLGIAYAGTGMKADAMQEYKKLQTIDKTWADKLLKGLNGINVP